MKSGTTLTFPIGSFYFISVELDPLTCPKCNGPMRVISFIADPQVIKKVLKHLGLWEVKPRPPPQMVKMQPLFAEPHIDDFDSPVTPSDNGLYVDPVSPAYFLP
jgi:hypothetical protein